MDIVPDIEPDAPEPPEFLGDAGRKLFADIVADTDFTDAAAELRLLVDACKIADLIAVLEGEVSKRPTRAKGSQGQPVITPEISELRFQRSQLLAFLKAISAATVVEEAAMSASEAAARASRARWDRSNATR